MPYNIFKNEAVKPFNLIAGISKNKHVFMCFGFYEYITIQPVKRK